MKSRTIARVKKTIAILLAAARPAPKLTAEARDELAYRAEVNARADARRAATAAAWDALADDRPRWVSPRAAHWFRRGRRR